MDINGNKLTDSDIIQSRIFDEYTTTPKEIEGYTLYALPENAIGITGEETVVNYIYKTKAPVGYSLSDEVDDADGVNLAEENGIYSFEYYDELLPVLNTGDTTDISKAMTLIVLIAALAGWLVVFKNLFKMN